MDGRSLELFNDSLERCQANPGFLDRFYEIFIASDNTVAAKFAATDLKRQQLMLKTSLYLLLEASGRNPSAESILHLDRIALLHDRNHHDVPPAMYTLWLDCMLRAVRESDRMCNPEVESAWRAVLAHGVEIMQRRY
ncbi:MAG: hypothetical protein ACRENN_02455 [Candidatus Eiseniibacteriota bacterium]